MAVDPSAAAAEAARRAEAARQREEAARRAQAAAAAQNAAPPSVATPARLKELKVDELSDPQGRRLRLTAQSVTGASDAPGQLVSQAPVLSVSALMAGAGLGAPPIDTPTPTAGPQGTREATSADDYWPPSHATELHDFAQQLYDSGTRGTELMSQVMGQAIQNYADDASLTPQQRSDAAMRDAAAVLMGTNATMVMERYDDTEGIVGRLSGLLTDRSDDVNFTKGFEGIDLEATGLRGPDPDAGGALIEGSIDSVPTSFKPGFDDETVGQTLHSFSFVFIGYMSNDPVVGLGANMVHEEFEVGSSPEDFNASTWGAALGAAARSMRDESGSASPLAALPAMVGAVYSTEGATYGNPDQPWNHGQDYTRLATAIDGLASRNPTYPSDAPAGNAAATILRALSTTVPVEDLMPHLAKLGEGIHAASNFFRQLLGMPLY